MSPHAQGKCKAKAELKIIYTPEDFSRIDGKTLFSGEAGS